MATARRVLVHAFLIAGALVMRYPLRWMFSGFFRNPCLVPARLRLFRFAVMLVSIMLPIHVLIIPQHSGGESTWGPMFAMATLSLVPVFAFVLVFQRRITEGISTTGLKG